MKTITSLLTLSVAALALAACDSPSYVQKESPANPFKDYREESQGVVGVGEPITKRQMKANATIAMDGNYTLGEVMDKVANTYNVAVRWGSGVRKTARNNVLIKELTFDEARSYIEDVYRIQVVREGERRLLVLPSADEARLEEFSPGVNVSLATAIRGLAEQCGMNLVINENKEKLAETTVTTSLKNITCSDAFEALLTPQGMSLVNSGDFYTIGGLPQQSWTVSLLEPLRTEEVRTSYVASLVEGQTGTGQAGGGGDKVNNVGGASEVIVREDRDLWGELEEDLNTLLERSCAEFEAANANSSVAANAALLPPPSLLGGGDTGGAAAAPAQQRQAAPRAGGGKRSGSFECGYVRINRSVGVVQMRAPKSVLEEADGIVGKVQEIASRRLQLDARVIAVTRERGFEQGTDGTGAIKVDDNNFINLGFADPTNSLRGLVSVTRNLASLGRGTGGLGGGGFATFRNSSIEAILRLVEQFGTTYSLMSPSMELMDRQRSTLIDGRNERYFVRKSETVTNNGDTIINTTAEERAQFVGLQFSVVAQIGNGDDDPHTVAVQIPITDIARTVNLTQNFNGDEITDEIPVANTRVIDQKFRIRDDEIKVVGGLTKLLAFDKESGLPIIRDIPLGGKLFNEESISYEQVEFLVLVQVKRQY